MSRRRIESSTSRTAEWTCLSRAASSLESDARYRSDDHIALLLVPAFLKRILHIPLARRFLTRVLTPKGIYEYTIARTKYIDSVFKEVLGRGCDQILIFGAGFDTRALRFQNEASQTRIFELDVPVTQRAKLGQYARRGLRIPANTTFISMDFDREVISEKLEEAGFAGERRTLFLLEGLLMYLQPASVDRTFEVIGESAGHGSEVLFDYVRRSVLRQAGSCYGEREIIKAVSKAGEQWHFGFKREEIGGFLERYGLRLQEHRDALDLERMYFTDESCSTLARVNGTHCIVRAVRP